jgi:hypothetical protein
MAPQNDATMSKKLGLSRSENEASGLRREWRPLRQSALLFRQETHVGV